MLLTAIGNRTNSVLQFVTVFLIFIFVIVITWGTTKWIAKIQKGQMTGGVNIEVIETQRINTDQYLQIVRAGNKYVLIAVGKTETHMITELSEDELIFKNDETKNVDFASVLEKFKATNKKED